MSRTTLSIVRLQIVFALTLLSFGSAAFTRASQSTLAPSSSYIVQADSAEAAAAAVARSGGAVTARLEIIDGVAATLDPAMLAQVRANQHIVVHSNVGVQIASSFVESPALKGDSKETKTNGYLLYPSAATGATQLHSMQAPSQNNTCQNQRVTVSNTLVSRSLQGAGVTVAFIDSGFLQMKKATSWLAWDKTTGVLETEYGGRCMVYRDFLPRSAVNGNAGSSAGNSIDQNGHGTHVVATVADSRLVKLSPTTPAMPVGVAPQVNLMIARALDKNGVGSYAQVISAIEWIVANKDTYNVRVLNLSLYAPVTGPYWSDPLNQAVMKAWQSGIVVVTAAGNSGPDAATITAPGNIPYVITTGAIKSGRYTTSGYDELATYSSRGPTESAFVKPDILVPASQTIAPIPNGSTLAKAIPAAHVKDVANVVDSKRGDIFEPTTYYRLSGTSMAAAQISGIVALMLQANPALTNNQVKYRLMASARPAIDMTTAQPVYSVWEQGAGLADTQAAVFSELPDSANLGMDPDTELTTDTHYWGTTIWDPAGGQFQLIDPSTALPLLVWDGSNRIWSGSNRIWSGSNRIWSGSNRIWSGGTTAWTGSISLWAGSNRIWSGSVPSTSLNTAATTEPFVNN